MDIESFRLARFILSYADRHFLHLLSRRSFIMMLTGNSSRDLVSLQYLQNFNNIGFDLII